MVTRFVEDLSRKVGRPKLGRAGYWGGSKCFYDDDHGGQAGAKSAAEAEESREGERRKWRQHWNSLTECQIRKFRQSFDWDGPYESVMEFAYMEHAHV